MAKFAALRGQLGMVRAGGAAGPSGPVQLTIAFVATQFDFKWKAPSGSTLVFHWGDGTTDEVSGDDANTVTTTSNYSGAGTYDFWITGDVLDLTYIDILGQTFVSGDVSGWSVLTDLTRIYVNQTGVSGDISGWSVLTGLVVMQVYLSNVTGDGSSWGALTNMVLLQCQQTALSGNISTLSTLTSATLIRFNLTDVTFDTTPAWTNSSCNIQFQDCGWTSQMVDNSIAALSTCTDSTINIAGTNAHRTAASNDDLDTLFANGNTITLLDTLGAELHTSLNAANDSVTEAITAFADHASTVDGSTKVTIANSVLDMIPKGAELGSNWDFSNWTDDDPDGFLFIGTEDGDNYVTEHINGAQFIYGVGGPFLGIGLVAFTIGKYYIHTIIISDYVEGSIRLLNEGSVQVGILNNNGTYTFISKSIGDDYRIYHNAVVTSLVVNSWSIKELEVLGSDLVTGGDFAANADMNVSNCVNGNYTTFGSATPTGFNATSNGGGMHTAGTADEISFVSGQKYVVIFDEVLNSGTAPFFDIAGDIGGGSISVEGLQLSSVGSNVFEFTSNTTTTGNLVFINAVTATDYEITNLSVSDAVTDWVQGDGWIVSGGVATHSGGAGALVQEIGAGTGTFLVKFTISGRTAGVIEIGDDNGGLSSSFTTDGTYTALVRNNTETNFPSFTADADFDGSIDNISTHKLIWTREIAASTNYTGTHYCLPVDDNNLIIPVNYSAEAIVAQLMSGESDATAGWTQIGLDAGAIQNVSNCVNGTYTTFGSATPTGFNATSNGGANHYAGTADEIVLVSGQKYVVTFDLVLNSGTAPDFDLAASLFAQAASVEGSQTSSPGSNVFKFTCNRTATGVVGFINWTTATNYEITNLSVTTGNVFESQGAVVDTGNFALHADANDTPTSAALAQINLIVENGETYRLSGDWRHIGIGGLWRLDVEGAFTGRSIGNSDTTFEEFVEYFVAVGASANIRFLESSGTNNGGVYYDNVSLKKVTFD